MVASHKSNSKLRKKYGVHRVGGKSLTISGIEHMFDQIDLRHPGDHILLPTQAKGLAVGGEAALVQWLITWAQSPEPFVLRTHATSNVDPQLDKLARRLYGLVAALNCDKARTLKDDIDVTKNLASFALARLEALQGANPTQASRGQSVEIICVDHLGRGKPKLLYKTDHHGMPQVRPRSDFSNVATTILGATIRGPYARNVPASASTAIAEMIFEIFRNTEDHARTNIDGNELAKSVRGFQARKHDLLPDDLEKIVGDFSPLDDFCKRLEPESGSKQVHIMELSFFDSGIGFAQSWTRKNLSKLSAQEELSAVEECFLKKSSKPSKGFGQGLPHVIRLLQSQGGFLRLRTGTLSLYADMGRSNNCTDPMPFKLNQWSRGEGQPLREATGVLITLLIPLKRTP